MNLAKKKEMAKKALGVGKNRICFNQDGISEIKEAITKQDIKDLYKEGIITIKDIKGRKKVRKKKTKRGAGKIKKNVNKRKRDYVNLTRKLRGYLRELRARGSIDRETFLELRKKLRMKTFKSQANLKEHITHLKKYSKETLKTTKKTKQEDKKTKQKATKK